LQVRIASRKLDLDSHQLVAALAVLRAESATLEAQDLARASTLGDGKHYRALGRRDLHFRPQHGFLQSHRKIEPDVGAFATEMAMRRNLDRDDRIAATGG